MIFALVTSVGEGIMSTLFTPFVRHVLHGSSQEFGLVVAAQAVGGIAGGMVAASLGHRARASRLLSCGAIVFGLVDLAIFLYPLGYVAVWPAAVGMIVVGVPGALCLAGPDHAVPAQQRGFLPRAGVRCHQHPRRGSRSWPGR